jgi:hypothetical protein
MTIQEPLLANFRVVGRDAHGILTTDPSTPLQVLYG